MTLAKGIVAWIVAPALASWQDATTCRKEGVGGSADGVEGKQTGLHRRVWVETFSVCFPFLRPSKVKACI